MPLLSLGMFVFAMDTLPFETLARKTSWRFGRSERMGALATSQFLGPGDDSVTVSGLLAPPVVGRFAEMRTLRELAAQGDAQPLVTGQGEILGYFTIKSIDERQSYITIGGIPLKTDFTIELERVEARKADGAQPA